MSLDIYVCVECVYMYNQTFLEIKNLLWTLKNQMQIDWKGGNDWIKL